MKEMFKSEDLAPDVAAWLEKVGCNAWLAPPMTFIGQGGDGRDILIMQTVKVRHRQEEFVDAESYPGVTVPVEKKEVFDSSNPATIWGYVIVNRAGTHICVIKTDTRKKWMKENRDGERVYTALLEDCLFIELPARKPKSKLLEAVIEEFDPVPLE